MNKSEYNAGTTARPCYSNIVSYGAHGLYRAIVPPTPVSIQPELFNHLHPHTYSGKILPKNTNKNLCKCDGYKSLNGLCRKCWSK